MLNRALVLVALAATAATAAPRMIHRRTPGHPRSFYTQASAGTAPTCYTTSGTPTSNCTGIKMQYYGGHVIANPKAYAVLWTSAVDATVTANIGAYLNAVTNSEMLDSLSEYDTNITVQAGTAKGGTGTARAPTSSSGAARLPAPTPSRPPSTPPPPSPTATSRPSWTRRSRRATCPRPTPTPST
jgi:hypothetical protein